MKVERDGFCKSSAEWMEQCTKADQDMKKAHREAEDAHSRAENVEKDAANKLMKASKVIEILKDEVNLECVLK